MTIAISSCFFMQVKPSQWWKVHVLEGLEIHMQEKKPSSQYISF